MKKELLTTFLLLSMAAGTASAIDMAEIQKLKEMGFTNEQIVEMTKSQSNANSEVSEKNAIPSANIERINSVKANHKGLLVICVSKEYPDRGPGFLDVFKNNEKIGAVELDEYVSNGPATQSKTNYFEYSKKNKGTSGTSTTTIANNICSRYHDVYEFAPGTYEIKLERKLYMGEPTSPLRFKAKKHKKFKNVTIEEGKVTVLSYYWEDNEQFGKDIVISGNHKQFVNDIKGSWGDNVVKVIEK